MSEDTQIQRKSRSRAMLVLVGCCFMQMVGLGTVLNSSSAYFAYVPVLANFDMVSYVLWITAYGIAALVGTFLGGILLPRNTRLWLSVDVIILAFCLFMFTLGTPEWTWQFTVIGVFMGLFGGQFLTYACPMLINAWFGSAIAGRYLGIANLFSGIGGAIFPIIFTQLFQVINWKGVYYVNIVLVLLILCFSLTVFNANPKKIGLEPYGPMIADVDPTKKPGIPLKYAVGSVAFVVLFIACIGIAFPGGYNSYIQANALNILGDGADTFASTLMTMLQIGYIVASLVGGYLCDKIGGRNVTIILFILTILAFLSWGLLATNEVMMVITALIFGMNNALVTISVPMIVRHHFGQKQYDKMLSYAMMGVGLGGALGSPIIAGFFTMTGSYSGAFLVGAAVLTVTLILVLISYAPAKSLRAKHWEAGEGEIEAEAEAKTE